MAQSSCSGNVRCFSVLHLSTIQAVASESAYVNVDSIVPEQTILSPMSPGPGCDFVTFLSAGQMLIFMREDSKKSVGCLSSWVGEEGRERWRGAARGG